MWFDKFKKILKIVIICLLVLAGAGFGVLYVVDTEKAKYILNWVIEFSQQPIPIIGVSSGFVIFLFTKTSLGKKALKFLKNLIVDLKNQLVAFKEETNKELEEQKQSYEEKLALVEYNRKQEREFIVDALSQIHNVGVQHALEQYKSMVSYEKISEVVDAEKAKLEKEYEAKFEAFTQALIADYEKKIAELGTKTAQEPTESVEPVEDTKEEEKVAE